MQAISKRRRIRIAVLRGLMIAATALSAALVIFLIVYVLGKGVPELS